MCKLGSVFDELTFVNSMSGGWDPNQQSLGNEAQTLHNPVYAYDIRIIQRLRRNDQDLYAGGV